MFLSPLDTNWGSALYLLIIMMNPDIRALFIMARCRVETTVDWWWLKLVFGIWISPLWLGGSLRHKAHFTAQVQELSGVKGWGRACLYHPVRCMWAGVFLQVILEVLSVTYNCTHENQLRVFRLLGAPGGCLKVVQLESQIFTTSCLLVGAGSESWVFYCWANCSFSIKNSVFEHKASTQSTVEAVMMTRELLPGPVSLNSQVQVKY